MNRVSYLVLALVAVPALLIVASCLASGSPVHTDPVLSLFTNPDGSACKRPCLFGVQPGTTSYEDALALLHAHPITHDFKFDLKHRTLYSPEVRITLHFEMGKPLSEIDLVRSAAGSRMRWGTLGSVVAGLSAPDPISINSDFTASYYLADHLVFHHSHLTTDRIGFDDRLEAMGVFAELPRIPSGATSWLGFSAARRYLPRAGAVHLRTGIMYDLAPGCSPRSKCRSDQ